MDDAQAATKKFQKEITSGIASLILLQVMDNAPEPMYGYQISKVLGIKEEETPLMKQGALYPVLRSMERYGLLSSKVEPSVSGPPRKYYTITKQGQQSLQEWKNIWQEAKIFVDTIIEGKLNYE